LENSMSSSNVGGSVITGSQSNTTSGGLGAGINVSELVAASMAPETQVLTVMQTQQTQVAAQQTALTGFNTDLQALQTSAFALTDPAGQLTQVAATSSNPSILTANALSGSAGGTHTIAVASLATTSSAYSAAVTTSSTAIAAGTLGIQVGTKPAVTITINSTNSTLDGLAQTINSTPNIGVTASVITDATGARLSIVSSTSGAPGDLTITPSAGVVSFTKPVTGANASLTVDGIPISSTTNTVTGTIPGVTLNLASPAPTTTVTLSLAADTTQQASAINTFVSAYNKVIGDLSTQFAVDPTTKQAGPLASDATLTLAQGQIQSSISFATSGNGAVNSLADLGVSLNNDGTLSVNNSTLATSLLSNPAAVQAFFQSTNAAGFGANLKSNLTALADPLTGTVSQDLTGLQQTQTDITQQISDFQVQLDAKSKQLTTQFDLVDAMIQQLPLLLSQVSSQLASL
jgi:flagellar hook-associated protein 2